MSLNLTELKDEPLGLAPTSADFCVPGTCFGDLTDEQLGKHPIPAMVCGCNVTCWTTPDVETAQDTAAPDDVRSFTFDVDGLSDEELDSIPRYAFACFNFPCVK